jgi:hypothetical protein
VKSRHLQSAPAFDLIAEGLLTNKSTGVEREIKVQIGRPHMEAVGAWLCPFKITGQGIDQSKYAGGVDAIQAIQLAFVMIAAVLQHFSRTLNLELHWGGEDDNDIGFP